MASKEYLPPEGAGFASEDLPFYKWIIFFTAEWVLPLGLVLFLVLFLVLLLSGKLGGKRGGGGYTAESRDLGGGGFDGGDFGGGGTVVIDRHWWLAPGRSLA